MRLETNAAIVQLAVETFDVRFEKGTLDAYRQIAHPGVKQALIRDETPFESRRHFDDCSYVGFRALEFCLRKGH